MDFIELALIEKLGEVLAYAVRERKYDYYELAEKWLASQTYNKAVDFDVALCSQAKAYILTIFEEEYKDNLPSINEDSPLYEDDMYWFGYVMAYWFMLDGTTGTEILSKYNVRKIIDEYDVLHTVSVKLAIELIKEDDAL